MSGILKAFLENESALKRYLSKFLSQRQDIEDIAQETFLKAYAAEANQELRSPKAFLFRVAKNAALDERTKASRARTDFIEDFAEPDVLGHASQTPLEDEVEARQVMGLLTAALAALPPQARQVFVMHRLHGLSHKEIARTLRISTSTVEKHVASALRKCTDYLRRHGCEPEYGRLRLNRPKSAAPSSAASSERAEFLKRVSDE